LRGDSAFCREHLMRWCEDHHVDYVFGLAKNKRLLRILGKQMHEAEVQFEQVRQPTRVFKDFTYKTTKSWRHERRVIGKAEHLSKGANPRFVVTSLTEQQVAAQELYEKEYCGRGDMENRIKEKKLFLFADRVSCATMRANQVRLCLASVAYVLMRALREFGLKQTDLQQAQCDTIRTRLLKMGAVVRVSVRRVFVAFSQAYAVPEVFQRVWENLRQLATGAGQATPSGAGAAMDSSG